MLTFATSVAGVAFGALLTLVVQGHLAQRAREYEIYLRSSEALADVDLILHLVDPQNYVTGTSEQAHLAWADAMERTRRARRELLVLSMLSAPDVANLIEELMELVSTAAVDTGLFLRNMHAHQDYKEEWADAKRFNGMARTKYNQVIAHIRRDIRQSIPRRTLDRSSLWRRTVSEPDPPSPSAEGSVERQPSP